MAAIYGPMGDGHHQNLLPPRIIYHQASSGSIAFADILLEAIDSKTKGKMEDDSDKITVASTCWPTSSRNGLTI